MNYRQTIDYLYHRLPAFHRVGATAYKPDLQNILALCNLTGNPQLKFRSVHVGGTNGKGSVSHMLAAVLQTAGYKTGLYTSPHLRDFRERIRVNGQMIPEKEVVDFVGANRVSIESLSPSFFEVTVAMAFRYFADQQVDIAIIEVGMGGRLDSTNIITPDLSVITNISYDHMDFLGNSLKKIAVEKAGIIKRGIPLVVGEYQPETAPVFLERAEEMEAPVSFASRDWQVDVRPKEPEVMEKGDGDFLELEAGSDVYGKHHFLHLDLKAGYQKKNIKTVLSAIEKLKEAGFLIGDEHMREALRQVKFLTGFAGRWQTIGTNPLVICDTGHNEDGIRAVLEQVADTPHDTLHMVFGMVNDKDVTKVLGMLPGNARYYFCRASVPRALDENVLREKALASGLTGSSYPTVKQAVEAAKNAACAQDLIVIGGSTFVVAEVV